RLRGSLHAGDVLAVDRRQRHADRVVPAAPAAGYDRNELLRLGLSAGIEHRRGNGKREDEFAHLGFSLPWNCPLLAEGVAWVDWAHEPFRSFIHGPVA